MDGWMSATRPRRTTHTAGPPCCPALAALPCPCLQSRLEILKIHASKITKHGDIDYEAVVKLGDGFNGADLRNICTEAGMFAIRDERDYVVQVRALGLVAVVEVGGCGKGGGTKQASRHPAAGPFSCLVQDCRSCVCPRFTALPINAHTQPTNAFNHHNSSLPRSRPAPCRTTS
jgi:SpoVK/Ycf46/Vps4 family AAA+-type ATPase